MLHRWEDDILRMDVPRALVTLLKAMDDAKFDVTQVDRAGLIGLANARAAAIRTLREAECGHMLTEAGIR